QRPRRQRRGPVPPRRLQAGARPRAMADDHGHVARSPQRPAKLARTEVVLDEIKAPLPLGGVVKPVKPGAVRPVPGPASRTARSDGTARGVGPIRSAAAASFAETADAQDERRRAGVRDDLGAALPGPLTKRPVIGPHRVVI